MEQTVLMEMQEREMLPTRKKQRMIVRRGRTFEVILIRDIAFCYTEERLTWIVDRNGHRYLSDAPLVELEELLDAGNFFRANRQYLINLEFIKSFRSYERVKLQVQISVPHDGPLIIISQETAPSFRKWVNEA